MDGWVDGLFEEHHAHSLCQRSYFDLVAVGVGRRQLVVSEVLVVNVVGHVLQVLHVGPWIRQITLSMNRGSKNSFSSALHS